MWIVSSGQDSVLTVSPWPIVPPGIWLDTRMAPQTMPRPALFLDRDGVIVRDVGYLSEPAKVKLVPETAALIKAAQAACIPVLVVTNQSGIDRGLFGWNDFAAVEARIADLLTATGVTTAATAACPFHPDHTADYDKTHASWRKPGPRMITALADRLNIDVTGSWLIGDRLRDVEAARNAGLAGGILIGDAPTPGNLAQPGFRLLDAKSADDALTMLKATTLFDTP